MEYRNLQPNEVLFIKGLLNGISESKNYILQLSTAVVIDLGARYCLRFLLKEYGYNDIECFGSNMVQKQIQDNDNVPILVSLDLDRNGNLYELDIWKADFSEIILDLLNT